MSSTTRFVELLAPAKDVNSAREAILQGADAVYIGAPRFSARMAAGNSIKDIAQVIEMAHPFHVAVYVALNTILKDEELKEAERIIYEVWKAGADGLIVQDPGVTMLDIPPIPLHASTQMHLTSIEEVQFWEQAGFSQLVLARELSLEEIRKIASTVKVRLEFFVHGALCVSYSGRCYLSQAMFGRSANRGECAQCCRLPFRVLDQDGNLLQAQSHVLSLKDLNLGNYLEDLIDAGISSLKIEGRLKDVSYVKNVTAWYRQRLDEIMERRPGLKRPSLGVSEVSFVPDPYKSFNRGFTTHFLIGRNRSMTNPTTPKSTGEPAGSVRKVGAHSFVLSDGMLLSNGDGLSFINSKGHYEGFRVNSVDGQNVFPARMPDIKPGTVLFRTYNQAAEKIWQQDTAIRYILVKITCRETEPGFVLSMEDAWGHKAVIQAVYKKIRAEKPQRDKAISYLKKVGSTNYRVSEVKLDWTEEWFVPASCWVEWRRSLCLAMDRVIRLAYQRNTLVFRQTTHLYPIKALSYQWNVLNSLAEAFYRQHGVVSIDPAMEDTARFKELPSGTIWMTSKFCLWNEWGLCLKNNGPKTRSQKKPVYLEYASYRLQIHTDCNKCLMYLTGEKKTKGSRPITR
jgi:putative protease